MNRWTIPDRYWALAAFFLLVLGCRGLTDVGAPPPTTPTATAPPIHTPTAAASAAPSATPLPAPSPSATEPTATDIPPTLPPTGAAPTPALPDPSGLSREALIAWLHEAWLAGFEPATLRPTLERAGWLPAADDPRLSQLWSAGHETWVTAELDATPDAEWALTILTGAGDNVCTGGLVGELWVINQAGLAYALAPPASSPEWSLPMPVATPDLSGDGRPEVVTQAVTCGAHTVTALFHVLSGHHGALAGALLPESPLAKLATPYRLLGGVDASWGPAGLWLASGETVTTSAADGRPRLAFVGGVAASAGAGYPWPRREIWGWDGPGLSLQTIEWPDSGQRYHRLVAANFALAIGDPSLAAAGYEALIDDIALGDEVPFGHPVENRGYTEQFAAFRLVLVGLLNADPAQVARYDTWLQDRYPDAPLTTAAQILQSAWAKSAGPASACPAVNQYLATVENPTGTLTTVGYGNLPLGAADLCPTSLPG